MDEARRTKQSFGDTVVAEAASAAVVRVEGNVHFPPDSIVAGALRNNPTAYTCHWKGKAQYHDVLVGDTVRTDGACCYADIKESAAARVGRYLAFDTRGVRIES